MRSRTPRVCRLLPIALALAAIPAAGQHAFPSDSAIRALITTRVQEGRSAGIVVGLLERDGRTRFLAAGDPGPGRPPLDRHSVFEIGSITKAFTGVLLADMVVRGEVALDDPVMKYLPASVTVPSRNGKEITLGQLSSQVSALPRLPANLRPADATNPYAGYTVEQLYEFLSGHSLRRDPGEQYEYSNLGVGLLGHALALRAGTSYEDLVRERILEPLDMRHTSITLTPWMREHVVTGHDASGAVTSHWDLPTLAGAGALRSNAEDMIKFLAAHLDETGPVRDAAALAVRPQAQAGSPAMAVGLGWHRRATGSDTIVWHNGGTGGFRTFAAFDPVARMAVVVLTNSGGQGADDIGFHLLDPDIALTPPPRQGIELPVATLERYVGTYELTPQFHIDVTLVGSGLYLQATNQPRFRLYAESETKFFLRDVNAQVTFEVDAGGAVTGLVLHQGGRDVPGRRTR